MVNPSFVYAPPTSPILDIVYQDDDIIVANKPSGLLTVPGKAIEHRDSLITRIQTVWPTATVVHRLDMATSGIIVMAMNKESHRHLSRQFETRKTKKRYFARVYGQFAEPSGKVDLPLICDWPNRPKQKVDHDNGKPALTQYSVIHTDQKWSLVKLLPVTGRSHQLRVHMLALGHPILGDRLYATDEALALASRLQLHAQCLGLFHPTTNEWQNFDAPLPFPNCPALDHAHLVAL